MNRERNQPGALVASKFRAYNDFYSEIRLVILRLSSSSIRWFQNRIQQGVAACQMYEAACIDFYLDGVEGIELHEEYPREVTFLLEDSSCSYPLKNISPNYDWFLIPEPRFAPVLPSLDQLLEMEMNNFCLNRLCVWHDGSAQIVSHHEEEKIGYESFVFTAENLEEWAIFEEMMRPVEEVLHA